MWRYRDFIPVPRGIRIVSMMEGGTPLIRLKSIEKRLGTAGIWMKFEGSNPTGSFKDRGMTVAITIAGALGSKRVISASTGNTAASMSAYARRAGMEPIVMVPKNGIAEGKISQLALYGARILEIAGNFDAAMKKALEISEKDKEIYLMNSVNPWRIEGQKTIAFEIIEELGVPDWIVIPVGNGGNTYAIWKGLKELRKLGIIDSLPKLLIVQAEGASPIVNAVRTGKFREVSSPQTIASAIRIGSPLHWERVLAAVRESGGNAVDVEDREILDSQLQLAREGGIGVESASASTLAGLLKALEERIVERGESAVLIGTGSALKEGSALLSRFPPSIIQVEGESQAIEEIRR
ncbi:MAG: threonine synthase [Fervidicoccaceae archaeon]